jgi:hypothetical protein
VGKWKEESSDKFIEFRADKTVTMGGKAIGVSLAAEGTYAFLEPNKLKIEFSGLAALAGPQIFIVSFPAPDRMTLQGQPGGKTASYTRAP